MIALIEGEIHMLSLFMFFVPGLLVIAFSMLIFSYSKRLLISLIFGILLLSSFGDYASCCCLSGVFLSLWRFDVP